MSRMGGDQVGSQQNSQDTFSRLLSSHAICTHAMALSKSSDTVLISIFYDRTYSCVNDCVNG